MTRDGIDVVFDIERAIYEFRPDHLELVGSGMGVGQTDEVWRDMELENTKTERDYKFSFSSLGNLKGDVPDEIRPNLVFLLARIAEEASRA